jgi:hypothetical protein
MLSHGVLHNSARLYSAGTTHEKLLVGSSSTSPLQSSLFLLWLSCVQANGKYTERSQLCYGCRCTGSNHILASLTATGLLRMWYNGLVKLWDACLNNYGAYVRYPGYHAVQCAKSAYLSNNPYMLGNNLLKTGFWIHLRCELKSHQKE